MGYDMRAIPAAAALEAAAHERTAGALNNARSSVLKCLHVLIVITL